MQNEEGKRLKLFMDREGYNQQDIAKLTKRQQTTISRYISGDMKIPLEFLKTLHLKCNLNYQFIFHGTGTMKYKTAEKRNIMNDVTDMLAGLAIVMESQDQMRADMLKLHRELYDLKQKQGHNRDTI